MAKAKSKPASAPAGSADVRTPPASDPGASTIGNIGLDQIRPSPLNPRKTFAPDSVAALADSIAQQGLLQPLVVRPMGDGKPATFDGRQWKYLSHFELLAGERRFRALKLLAESDRLPSDRVPVTVRWLSDAEALSLMIVENEQREDVRPSEQAAGYARLLAESGSVEHVAKTVSQTVAFVRQMIRLTKLPAWALAALDAGILKKETAALVARVPGEESRKRAACCVLTGRTSGMHFDSFDTDLDELERGDTKSIFAADLSLSYRDAKELIRTHFQVELKGAPFDRKALYVLPGCEPGHERSMPACEPCPSRAGNDPEAQAEGVRGDVCLDPECFREKCEAHREKVFAKHAKDGVERDTEMDGRRDLSKWCDPSAPVDMTGVLRPDELPAGDGRWKVKLSVLLSKAMPQRWLSFDEKGKPRVLARIADARRALVDLGVLTKEKPKAKAAAKGADADLKRIEPVPLVRYRVTLNEAALAAIAAEFEAPADRDPNDWYVRDAAIDAISDALDRHWGAMPAVLSVSKIDEPAEAKAAKAELQERVAASDAIVETILRGTLLADVPDFPAEACEYLLLTHTVQYVEQITAKVAEIKAERGRQNATVYEALKAFGVATEHGLYAAGDALVDHLDPITLPLDEPKDEPKPAKKAKVAK